jgi:methylmalonyl-CoA mutase
MTKNEKITDLFPPVSTTDWMEKIKADLKGADFNKKMVWRTIEGFEVMPFYRSEDISDLKQTATLPGEFPYLRGANTVNRWFVRQNIKVTDYKEANRKALDILMRGVDSLGFIIDDPATINVTNITTLLDGIKPEIIELNFATAGAARELVKVIEEVLTVRGVDLSKVDGSVEADPLGRLMINGSLCVSVEEGLDYLAALFGDAAAMPQLRVLQIGGHHFANAGCDIVRELAFTLSLGNEYMSQLVQRGISIEAATAQTGFTIATGSNYFMEIAKLRAARLLWSTVINAYNPSTPEACRMRTTSVTSEWNKTVYDPYVNMLRTQTEAMSATLGGTDALVVAPFDAVYGDPNIFSERVARNQQLLLKEEAHFDKVTDPGAGSYYIEKLTAMIAEEAWKLFVDIEEKGGFLAALKEGIIQSSVEEIAAKRLNNLSRRKEVLLGTNQYPSSAEKVSPNADMKRVMPVEVEAEGDYEVKPLKLFRGAVEFERLRLAVDRLERRPSAFMLTTGNLAMRMARSQFSANFFACAGYEIIMKGPFPTAADGAAKALEAGADIVVVCSSDDEYATIVPEALEIIGEKAIVVVAGEPPCMDDLKQAGAKHFISMRSNVLETLKSFHDILGIEY